MTTHHPNGHPMTTNPMTKHDRHDELVDLLTQIRDRLPGAHDPVGSQCRRDYCEEMHDPAPADDLPGDPVEALARVLWEIDDPEPTYDWDRARANGVYQRMARAAREHIEGEMDKCYAQEDATAHDRAERAQAERDEMERRFDKVHQQAIVNAEAADGWRAKHAALREDVDRLQREHKALPAMWDFVDALGHDDARTPQPDPDTVTLRREDVAALLDVCVPGSALSRRVREASGWSSNPYRINPTEGDNDD